MDAHGLGVMFVSIAQVAQLAEQQVQGCTARIAHLETDLLHQVDSLKQQHHDQASSLVSVKAHLEQLSAVHQSSGSEQVSAQLNTLEARVTEMQKLSAAYDKDAGQLAAHLGRLDKTVTELQTASTQDKADMQLRSDVNLLKTQMQELHDSCRSHEKAASVMDDLKRDLASVKAETCDSQTSNHSAESAIAGLQQDLVVLKEQLAQLSVSHAQEASKTQQPVLKLEHTVAELSGAVSQLKSRAEGQHLIAETFSTLQHDMSDLKAQVAQLQSERAIRGPSMELYSSLEHNVAATKDQLSSLRKQVAQHAEQDPWREESQKLRSELDACLKAACSAEAEIARHSTKLSSMDTRLADLHAELKEGNQASGHPQNASQSEVEALNERLFELRVEVQNLADDTGISIASMKRKVRTPDHSVHLPYIAV